MSTDATVGSLEQPDPHPVVHAIAEALTRPLLRGWLHVAAAPFALAMGIVLVCLAPAGNHRLGAVVYMLGATAIFAVSGTYHRWAWGHPTRGVPWRRADHAVIFIGIASTYTPLALTVLHGSTRATILWVVWSGALVGAGLELALARTPKIVTVPLYLALGWVAVFIVPHLLHGAGVAALVLLFVGGALYSVGAVVYALGRPMLFPSIFGPHEFFHACTVLAYACHAVVVAIAVLR